MDKMRIDLWICWEDSFGRRSIYIDRPKCRSFDPECFSILIVIKNKVFLFALKESETIAMTDIEQSIHMHSTLAYQ